MPPVTIDGSLGITTPMYNGSITANAVTPSVNMKNRIINGAMVIDQRNAGASVTPADGQYTLDRFNFRVSQSSKLTCQQNAGSVTPPVGFTNYLGVTSSSAYSIVSSDYFVLDQNIEGFNTADLNWGTANAKTVTLSFWVRSSLTGTFGGVLGNSAFDRSYPYTYTINAANTWEYKTITIAGDTSGTWVGATNGLGLRVRFGLGVGSTFSGTAGAWAGAGYSSATGATSVVGTNGATFYITGVQLEVGSTATSFDYRPYGTELALCQRYYEKSYAQATAVPTNAVSSYVVFGLGTTTYYGGSTGDISQNLNTAFFKVTKRANPTVTTYSYTSSTTSVASNGWTGADLAAGTATVAGADTLGFNIYNASGANRTVNPGSVIVHFAASVEL